MPSGVHARGRVAGLLAQLALRGGELRLARIELAGRELDEHLVERIAELALDDEAPVGKHRHDQHGAGMHDVLARREAAVGQAHRVAAHVQQLAVEHRFGRDLRFDQVRIVRGFARVRSPSQSFATRKSV